MTRQMLLYDRAVPLSRQRHGDWSIETNIGYGFTRGITSMPLMATEITAAAREYCIVFAGQDDFLMPVVVLGVRDGENAYVDAEGRWQATYVPAFVRRYPFVFSSHDGGTSFTLCIDEEFQGCNREGRGENLFDASGEQTPYLQNVVDFVKQYQLEFQRTKAFCERLLALDLLEDTKVQMKMPDGQSFSLMGFSAVNRDRLKRLDAAVLAELAREDLLEAIYVHLQSMRNFHALAERSIAGRAAADVSALHGPPAGTA